MDRHTSHATPIINRSSGFTSLAAYSCTRHATVTTTESSAAAKKAYAAVPESAIFSGTIAKEHEKSPRLLRYTVQFFKLCSSAMKSESERFSNFSLFVFVASGVRRRAK